MAVRTILPPFDGGEEKIFMFTFLEDDEPADLTDHTITAEIWWDDCRKICLAVDDGVEILNAAPPVPPQGEDPEPQFQIILSEVRTKRIPRGKGLAYLKIIDLPPDGKTEISGPYYLERDL